MEVIGIDSRPIVYPSVFIDGRWLLGGLFPSATRAAQMVSLLFALWFVVVCFVEDAPQYPLWGLASAPIGLMSCPAPILRLALLRPSKEVCFPIGCVSAAIAREAVLLAVFPPLCAPAVCGKLEGCKRCCPPPPLPLMSAAGWGVAPRPALAVMALR